jgi:tellurite resistance protein
LGCAADAGSACCAGAHQVARLQRHGASQELEKRWYGIDHGVGGGPLFVHTVHPGAELKRVHVDIGHLVRGHDVRADGAEGTVTAMYVCKGGARPRALVADLRHPEQGFALGYIPVIPLLLLANAAPRTAAFRILDLGLAAIWALGTAALVAHWITTSRDRHALHPGFSLPVVGGPFIACISLQANGWHGLATGLFMVGVYFGLTFGSLIVGRLMTEQRLSDARFPTLAVLMVAPATASTAWFALNGNRATTFGIGLAAVLAMMALIQLFIVPEYLRRPFTISCWSFSFPLASAANAAGHWALAAPGPTTWWLAWSTLILATAVVGLLVILTVRMMWRWRAHSRPPTRRFHATLHDTGPGL